MLSDQIKAEAARIGFDLVGIAPAVTPAGLGPLRDWLDQGFAGEMHYIERRAEAYAHPRNILDGARSVVMLGLNYHTPASRSDSAPTTAGRVSSYAWGEADYHEVIRAKLAALADFVRERQPDAQCRGVVDTAPLLERDFARLAGLGWFGKNTLLINKQQGSWLFLAALLVDIELDYDAAHTASHCGSCTRCLEACPTDAFVAPYVLDARRCISYLTIELRGSIPLDLREGMGAWVFGCDVCQTVCPWNRKAPTATQTEFLPREGEAEIDPGELLGLDDAAFRARFRGTPLARPKRAGLLRNAAIVLGNLGDPSAIPALVAALNDREPLIRGACAWALGRLGGPVAEEALRSRLTVEHDAEVANEVRLSLAGATGGLPASANGLV